MKKIRGGLFLTVAISFMLFVYAPLELYFNNIFEFWFDLSTLGPILVELFFAGLAVGIIMFILLERINLKLYRGALVIGMAIYLASYIQGNFLIGNLPVLDGHAIEWGNYGIPRLMSALVWVMVLVGTIFIYKKIQFASFELGVKYITSGITLMLLVTLISVCAIKNGLYPKTNYCLTYDHLMDISKDKNFVVLLLDCVDSGAFDRVLEQHDEYKEVLSDFTYFDDAMSTYGFTEYSVPYIYSGIWYENEGSIFDYGNAALRNSPLVGKLGQQGYRIGLYSDDFPMTEDSLLVYDNVVASNGNVTSWSTFVEYQLKLVGLRYAPFELKKYCIFDTNSFWELREVEGLSDAFTMSNEKFYFDELEKNVSFVKDKVFKFIHIEGAHEPFHLDENMNEKEDATYENNVEASVAIIKKYVEMLKNAGVYDNTAIIILSDHGWDSNYEHWVSRQDPILLTKGFDERHPMQINSAPISYVDLQEAYARILEGKKSEALFDFKEGQSRERRFLWYDLYTTDCDLEEYIQTGKADDEETFLPTGVVFGHLE